MATSRLTCPDCKAVLKPAKPVPDGKKVKCPKCGNTFTAPGLVESASDLIAVVEEEDERPRKAKKPGRKEKAAIKKARDARPAPKKKPDDDDDEGGGIYSPISDPNADEEERPDIEYAPDLSIKDLRGPAQEAVVKPSNWMLLIAGLCCIGDILIICVSFWPMVFSESILDHEVVLEKYYKSKGTKEAADKIKNIPKERKDLKKEELAVVEDQEDENRIYRFYVMGACVFLLLYNAVTIVGAVKMQNLESRRWGIAASVMTLLPPGAAGLGGVIGGALYFTIGSWILDELNLHYSIGLGAVVYLVAVFVGMWSLRTLMEKRVVDGFAYVAD